MSLRRWSWMVAAAALLIGSAPLVGIAAAEPLGQFARTLTFVVDRITPDLVTAAAIKTDPLTSQPSATMAISGTITNTGQEVLTHVVARVQRGDALDSPAALQAELADPGQPATSWTDFGDLIDTIAPGATVPFRVTAEVFGTSSHGLATGAPGVYPVMVNVNAKFESGPSNGARVGELHALLTVAAVPIDPSIPVAVPVDPSIPPGTAVPVLPPTARQTVNVLLPLVDRPHRDPSGAFFDDDLTALITTGGRLDRVLEASGDTTLPAGSVTLAVDPELLEELQLMAGGYFVGPFVFDITRGTGTATSSVAETTPTTAGSSPATTGTATTDPAPIEAGTAGQGTTPATPILTGTTGSYLPTPAAGAVPGTGTQAAIAFLGRLRSLAATMPTLVLPYTDIDAVAAVRAGHGDQLRAAISHGRELAAGILGTGAQLVSDVSWPIDGVVDDATLSVLQAAGLRTAVLNGTAVTVANPATTAAIPTGDGQVTAVLSTSALPVGAVGLNTFTAETAQNYFSNVRKSLVYAPDRSWQPSVGAYPEVTRVLGELAAAGIVGGTSINALAGSPSGVPGTLAYPAAAAEREIAPVVFSRVADLVAKLAATQKAFDPTGPVAPGDGATTAPDDLFDGYVDGMSRQAAGGFRTNPDAGGRSISVVDSIISTVQAGVFINPPTGSVTLTSNSSPIPMSIRNDWPYAVHLRVRITPEDALRAGIQVRDVGIQTIAAGRTQSVLIPAKITRAGSLSLRVQLTNSDSALWGAEQTLEMKSTAYGAFTVTMIIVAAGVVVLTSAGRIRKRYRERRQRIEAGLQ